MDWTGLIAMGGFVAFAYAFIIRPQQVRQRQARDLVASLAPGDEVITIGGLHGRITQVEDSTVTLRASDGVELVFDKNAVGQRVEQETAADE